VTVLEPLVVALFLAVLNKALVDWIVAPVRKKWPTLDLWFLVYVSGVTGFVIGWLAQVNVLTDYVDDLLLARILSSLLVGGGASLIHDVFDRSVTETIVERTEEGANGDSALVTRRWSNG